MAGQWQCPGAGVVSNPPDMSVHIKAALLRSPAPIHAPGMCQSCKGGTRWRCPCSHEWKGPQGCSYGFLKPRTSPQDAASAKAVMRKDQRTTRQGGSAAPGHLRSPPRAPGAGRALHRSAAADSCLSHPLLRSLPGHPFPAGHCQPDSRDCSMAAASRSASRPPARRGIAAAVPTDSRCSGSGFHSFPFFHTSGTASAQWGCAEEEPKSFSLSSPVTTSSPRPPSALCAQGGVAAH